MENQGFRIVKPDGSEPDGEVLDGVFEFEPRNPLGARVGMGIRRVFAGRVVEGVITAADENGHSALYMLEGGKTLTEEVEYVSGDEVIEVL